MHSAMKVNVVWSEMRANPASKLSRCALRMKGVGSKNCGNLAYNLEDVRIVCVR